MPDPPAPAVFQQLQNLAKQNPIFAQNLQYIILTQIQSLQSKSNANDSSKKDAPIIKGVKLGAAAGTSSSQGQMISGDQTVAEGAGPVIGDNTRAALVILLAAQMQAQMGNNQPSLLGNPQMLASLQNLLKQSGPSTSMAHTNQPTSTSVGDISTVCSGGPTQSHPQFRFPPSQVVSSETRKNPMKNGFMKGVQKVPLLPNPPTATSPSPEDVSSSGSPFPNPPPKDMASTGVIQDQPPLASQDPAAFWNWLLLQLQNQNNLSPDASIPINKNGLFELCHMGFNPENILLGDEVERVGFPIQVPPQHGKLPHPQSLPLESESSVPFPIDMQPSGDLQQTISTLLDNANNLNRLLGTLTTALQSGPNVSGLPMPGSNAPTQGLTTQLPAPPPQIPPGFPFMGQGNGTQPVGMQERLVGALLRNVPPRGSHSPDPARRGSWPHVSSSSPIEHQRMPVPPVPQPDSRVRLAGGQPSTSSPIVPHPGRAILGSPVRQRSVFPHLVGSGIHEPVRFLEVKGSGFGSPFPPGWPGGPPAFISPPPGSTFRGIASPPGGMVPGIWTHPNSPSLLGPPPAGVVTPIGHKRKYDHILPSPEPSPEGNYIGQHSQGIGGHYADSYFKRKKKN
ncbi:hypothetical protein J437_LFUL014189 [Ladona fulva]|uniref:Uncharacterized protein n=1 Tax=Ladona fulva TaxID=123851 RepID=A0A8K0KHJ3_LADFU|nr:hypothetical protein J437_LFUL014189 [Ladona fulva]